MQHPRFRNGDLATDFIADEYPEGFDGAPADAQLIEDLAVLAGMVGGDHRRARGRDRRPVGRRRSRSRRERVVRIAGGEHLVRIKPYDGGTLAVIDDGELVDIVGRWEPGQRLLSANVDGRHRIVQVRRVGRGWELQTRGRTHRVQVLAPARRRAFEAHDREGPAGPVAAAAGADAGAGDRLDVKVGDMSRRASRSR